MPSTVSCSCTKKEPYPGYVLYDVTVTFDYVASGGGLKLQTTPPPFAQILNAAGGVVASGTMTPSGAQYTATFNNLLACPTKSKVLYREEQISPTEVESNGCPCSNCRTTKGEKPKPDGREAKGKKKKKK